jgi:membrane-associated protein
MIDLLGELNQVFDYLSGQTVWWGMVILASSAIIEYVFPPFPGDTITLVGAVLIPKAGWPVWGVFGAVMVGTALGAAIDWRIGIWLADHETGDTWLHDWLARERIARKIETVKQQFEKWGSAYLMANRFVPAFRSVFFVAAGLARLPLKTVLLFGCLSAGLWNAALLAGGYAVGYNLQELAAIIDTYAQVFWLGVIVAVALWMAKIIYGVFRDGAIH